MHLPINCESDSLLKLQQLVQDSTAQIIDVHIYNEDLNAMLHSFVSYKQAETSIWPKLTLYTHFMMGGASSRVIHAAAQTELIILSLDIFDDLQDQDNFAPPWMSCEPHIAMNAASALLIAAIAGDMQSPLAPSLLKLISKAHNGQHNDLLNTISNEEEYIQLIGEKSAALISLAIQLGYLICENPEYDSLDRLHEMAEHIGIAAQLENDINNIDVLGTRNDIFQRKTTIATLFLLEQSDSSFPLLRQYYNGQCEQQDLLAHNDELSEFIRSSGVNEYSNAVQLLYSQKALQLLDDIAVDLSWKHKFKEIAIDPFLKIH